METTEFYDPREVTIEKSGGDVEANELAIKYAGKRATIVAHCFPFAFLRIEGVEGIRGCLMEFLQVVPTAKELAARFQR